MGDLTACAATRRLDGHQEGFNLLMWHAATQVLHPDPGRFGSWPVVLHGMNHQPIGMLLKKRRNRHAQRSCQAM